MTKQNVLGFMILATSGVLSFVTAHELPAQEQGAADSAQTVVAGEANFILYVTVDEVKREMDRGADLVLFDARARPDYLFDHITGAISMPFYEVEERFAELPMDKWIIAYCACPRAEAERAVVVLQAKGFERVAVMYEGYVEWKERGYPVSSGEGS